MFCPYLVWSKAPSRWKHLLDSFVSLPSLSIWSRYHGNWPQLSSLYIFPRPQHTKWNIDKYQLSATCKFSWDSDSSLATYNSSLFLGQSFSCSRGLRLLRKASYHSISYITLRCGLDPSAIGTPVNVVGLSPRTIGNSRTWICPKQTIFVGTLVPFGKMQLFMVVKESTVLLWCGVSWKYYVESSQAIQDLWCDFIFWQLKMIHGICLAIRYVDARSCQSWKSIWRLHFNITAF